MRVLYYITASGRSPVEEFILDLPEQARLEVADAITLLESGEFPGMPLSRNLSNKEI